MGHQLSKVTALKMECVAWQVAPRLVWFYPNVIAWTKPYRRPRWHDESMINEHVILSYETEILPSALYFKLQIISSLIFLSHDRFLISDIVWSIKISRVNWIVLLPIIFSEYTPAWRAEELSPRQLEKVRYPISTVKSE